MAFFVSLESAALRRLTGLLIEISFGLRHPLPSPPKPHLGQEAGGAGSRSKNTLGTAHSTALLGEKSQSFLHNLLARCPPELSSASALHMSAFDPKRTSAPQATQKKNAFTARPS